MDNTINHTWCTVQQTLLTSVAKALDKKRKEVGESTIGNISFLESANLIYLKMGLYYL